MSTQRVLRRIIFMTRKNVIRKIAIPVMATVLIVGSSIVALAGTSRDSVSSGGLTMQYFATATDHSASAGASVNTCSDLYVGGTAYKKRPWQKDEEMHLGNSASQTDSVYASVSSEWSYFTHIDAEFGAVSNDDDEVNAAISADY